VAASFFVLRVGSAGVEIMPCPQLHRPKEVLETMEKSPLNQVAGK
jgi:hypothetical protein